MTDCQFDDWVRNSHRKMVENWDRFGMPPKMGRSESTMIKEFNRLTDLNLSEFVKNDELTPNEPGTIIQNTIYAGSEVDQFFENMMKTKMTYGTKGGVGVSIYDILSDPKFEKTLLRRSRRHFRRDSFYQYSIAAVRQNAKKSGISCKTGIEWVRAFRSGLPVFDGCDFWLCENKKKEEVTSGYRQVVQSTFLSLSKQEVLELHAEAAFSNTQLANIQLSKLSDDMVYTIRFYKRGQRIYPKGFIAYRVGYVSNPVNFPAMTAKFLYEKYTDHLVKQDRQINIYDPSSGWGGRLLGALSVRDNRHIHYVGTDPNPENVFVDGKTKYEHIVEFFNTKTYRGTGMFSSRNTAHIFTDGSEEIHKNPDFHQYTGKMDVVFTSPPYFNRELYSTDANQSCVKFTEYESWRDGFLIPTLKTAIESLRPGGYLLWNIADVLTPAGYLPLEKDSVDFILQQGMIQEPTLKMALQLMAGQQRLDENGVPKCKNYYKLNGKFGKYEPIFVFRKPE